MAGKPKKPSERRSHPFQIRLTEGEFAALDERARALNVNLSDMIRAALGLPTTTEKPFEFDAKLCRVCGQLMVKGQTIHDTCK